ncbi:STAS domain-containing protein [Umezawaea sp. Da 62-37]|uniref:STAS domain-containing protein n=1 Tax=Umezawaea sp. Da 62-37 TaxID=3075927 RepID=UPI0028F6C0D0|nr:STAS domain-containing protein [Umezawaea sp. Da 62-37]WNV83855.1 STAS domain-containing protein [Umezawaea sp. Da 62-37]
MTVTYDGPAFMDISSSYNLDAVIVTILGKLNDRSVPKVATDFALIDDPLPLVVDLSGVTYIGLAALRWLVKIINTTDDLRMVPCERVIQALDLMDLEKVVRFYTSVEDANNGVGVSAPRS